MLLSKLRVYTRGYAVVELDGMSLEKLVNSLSKSIRLYQVRRQGRKIVFRILYHDLDRLKRLIPEGSCTVSVIKLYGMQRQYALLKPRFMLVYGVLAALLIYISASCFIWQVNVEGVSAGSKAKILQIAGEKGVKRFSPIWSVDRDAVENALALNMPELAWVTVNQQGSRINIKAVEMKAPAPIVDRTTPTNVISKKDAVIYKILPMQGQPRVKEGESVTKGQILISGFVEAEGVPTRTTHAMGKIMGIVKYTADVDIPMYRIEKVRTGRTSVSTFISIADKRFTIESGKKFVQCETVEQERLVMGKIGLPVKYITVTSYEMVDRKVPISITEALKAAANKGYTEAKKQAPADGTIHGKGSSYQVEGDMLQYRYELYVIEDLGAEQPIE